MSSRKTTFPVLYSNRLELRSISEKDATQILFLRSNDIVGEFIERPKMKTINEAKQFIKDRIEDIKNKKVYYWVISLKDENELIGTICFWNFSEDKSITEIGYDLKPEYFSKGIMSEAIKIVINFGFQTLKLSCIEAFTNSENTNSIKLLVGNNFELQLDRKDKGFPRNKIFVLKNPN